MASSSKKTEDPPKPSAASMVNPFCNSTCKVYEREVFKKLTIGMKVAACMISEISPVSDEASVVKRAQRIVNEEITWASNLGCSTCNAGPFETRSQQIAHYKHHWHTYNLRRRLLGRPAVTLVQFNTRDETASSSDSESDTDTNHLKRNKNVSPIFLAATRHCRAYFTNRKGLVFSVYRCLLHHKKEPIGVDGLGEKWVEACNDMTHEKGWAVLMCSGGHFAAAIFRGESDVAVKHKTLHSYVTRKGQGKAQVNRDSRSSNAPRSAGSSLRRYNQETFAQHVREFLTSWKEHLEECTLILYRAVGPINKAVIFGTGSPLMKSDTRLRTLPFPTRKPSFKEIRRAHDILTTVEIYNSVEIFQKTFQERPKPNNAAGERAGRKGGKASPGKIIDRAKSREKNPRPTPGVVPSSEDEGPCYDQPMAPPDWTKTLALYDSSLKRASKISTSDEDVELDKRIENIDLDDENNPHPETGLDDSKSSNSEGKLNDADTENNSNDIKTENGPEKLNGHVEKVEEREFKSRRKGPVKIPPAIKKLWQSTSAGEESLKKTLDAWDGPVPLVDAINTMDPVDGNTLLHKVAMAEMPEVVMQLLELGADPCCKNILLQTPYCATGHQDTRIAFRLYQGMHPDKYQYAKANIPGPLTLELLEEEKIRKAAAKKVKRQKDKERQTERSKTAKYLALSDKDKLSELTNRCFGCGIYLRTIPFTYEEYKFCQIKCLHDHRNARRLRLAK